MIRAASMSESCRVVLAKYIWNCASVGFIQKEFITVHGHRNIKLMYYPGIFLEELRNTRKTSDRRADSRNDI